MNMEVERFETRIVRIELPAADQNLRDDGVGRPDQVITRELTGARVGASRCVPEESFLEGVGQIHSLQIPLDQVGNVRVALLLGPGQRGRPVGACQSRDCAPVEIQSGQFQPPPTCRPSQGGGLEQFVL